MNRSLIERYRENWQDEVDSAAQYRALSQLAGKESGKENDEKIARVFASLARVEEAHIEFWEARIRAAGGSVAPRRPSWRSRTLIFIARTLGSRAVLSTIAANESVGRNTYLHQPETRGTRMTEQERWHAKVMGQLVRTEPGGVEGGFLARLEGRHRAVGGNALRAAVLGANDGLCSNLSLVMGAAGATASSRLVILTGLAGLFAGAFSMALGEWVSVTSSRELAERELRIEENELTEDPEGEGEELRLIYEAKGFTEAEAKEMSGRLVADKSAALDALSREELGIDPGELGGSAWSAASASFLLFSLGALVPVLPLFVFSGKSAIALSLGSGAIALFLIGAAITIFTGRSAWRSGLRQLALGLCAAGVTYFIGHWIGVSTG